ncbi:hypothetical protein D3C77_669570 [compost metagenome]
MLALEFAKALMERDLHAALDPATDPALAAKLRARIVDRGIGPARDEDAEEATQRKKGGNASDAVAEFLMAISRASNERAGIAHQDTPVPSERDVTPHDGEWFAQYSVSIDSEGDDDE